MPKVPRAVLALLAVLLALHATTAGAQGARSVRAAQHAGTTYLELTDLARAAGDLVTAAADALTYRGALGVVTFFAASSDGLMQRPADDGPAGVAFSAPVVRVGAEWWAPLDALDYLGMQPGAAGTLLLPGGAAAELVMEGFPGAPAPRREGADGPGWEVDELGPGVSVLRIYAGPVALTLLDLALLPLARPELTAEVDAALAAAWDAGSARDHVLLMQVTALEDAAWEPTLRFSQAGNQLEVRHPYRLLLQEGAAGEVGPNAPVAGVVLLPAVFDLYRPLRVEWGEVSAEVSFRR